MDISCSEIRDFINEKYNIDISGRTRADNLAHYRNIYYILSMRYADEMTFSSIGKFVDRDHSTVLYGYTKLKDQIATKMKMFRKETESFFECEEELKDKYPDSEAVELMTDLDSLTDLQRKRNIKTLKITNKKKDGKIEKLQNTIESLKLKLSKIKGIEVKLEKVG